MVMSSYRAIPGALIAALIIWGVAGAQPTPPPADPDAVLVEELVVTARYGGPAWWTVAKPGAAEGDKVYVLGSPSLAPKRMQWDRLLFDRRLKDAKVVILPFQDFKVSGFGAIGAGVNMLRLKSATPFEEKLDPATRARFAAAREALGQPAKRYGTGNALAAGLLLADDYREKNELTTTDPTKLIKLLATRAHVPVEEKRYNIGPQLGAIIRTPPEAARTCFDEVLRQAETGPGVTRAAATAWAAGDVRGALGNERTYERCFAAVPGAQAFDARIKTDQADAIARALQTPGHAIAVVQLRPLLAQGGVLDQLRSRGFVVTAPGAE
jgi:uncharacterized protein YbaP (TraB family)